jgi:AraC family transcriptional activator of mtrCDE
MSRATLARQFQEKLGRSASDLLTDIRMTLASNELKKPSMSTAAVADAVGYQSEAAFQRAFKSYMGLTPAQWRKGGEFSIADHSVTTSMMNSNRQPYSPGDIRSGRR